MRIRAARDWKLLLAVVAALAAGDLLFQLDQLPGGDVQNRKAYESTLLRNNLLVTPGVSAVARVVSTPQGLRGDLLSWRSFNVVVAGGSTVFCRLLGEEKTLTARLAAATPAAVRRKIDLRVATEGRGGQSVPVTYANLTQLFAQPSARPDLVVAQFGANSLMHFLSRPKFTGRAAAKTSPPRRSRGSGKPKNPVPAVGLGIVPDHQAASLCSFFHRS